MDSPKFTEVRKKNVTGVKVYQEAIENCYQRKMQNIMKQVKAYAPTNQ